MNSARRLVTLSIAMLIAGCVTPPAPPLQEPPAPAPAGPDITGTWALTTESQMGSEKSELVIKQRNGRLSGTLVSARLRAKLTGGIEGDAVKFGFLLDAPGDPLRIDYIGLVEGDSMKGKAVFGAFGEGAFTATRVSGRK